VFGNAYADTPELVAPDNGIEKCSIAPDSTDDGDDDKHFFIAAHSRIKPTSIVLALVSSSQTITISSHDADRPSVRAPPYTFS